MTANTQSADHVCAVDVGTRSARAGVFAPDGQMLARAVAPFEVDGIDGVTGLMHSDDILRAVALSLRGAVAQAAVDPSRIAMVALDATCSLVLRDTSGHGLSLDEHGRDTLAWFDQRAVAQAKVLTQHAHPLIDRQGGAMSPEMQLPKLMWLKANRPDLWAQMGCALDLADDLTAQLTGRLPRESAGEPPRSACTTMAKWPWVKGWTSDLFDICGLDDLPRRAALSTPAPVGSPAGALTPEAAARLGLHPGTAVATGLVDAFAGALGAQALLGARATTPFTALIAGTSASLMSLGPAETRGQGIWGPYPDILHPGHLLAEAGPMLGADLHVLPDFAGNRAPLADPLARGVISGLSLDRSFDGLCRLYWRAALSIALGLAQIRRRMAPPEGPLVLVGGMANSTLLTQLFADVLDLPIRRFCAHDVVLCGTALAGFRAMGAVPDMARDPEITRPDPTRRAAYAREARIFALMQEQRAALAAL